MPITFGSNIAAMGVQRHLHKASDRLQTTMERLSSGQRINKPGDDAAGLAIAEALELNSRVFNQGVRNIGDAVSLINIADSAIEELTHITVRLQELAEQSANGTYSSKQRDALDREAQALAEEFARISKSTSFNDKELFTGGLGEVQVQAGIGENGIISSGIGGAIGTGAFNDPLAKSVGSIGSAQVSADFNGDGNFDLAVVDSGDIRVFYGTGTGSFSDGTSFGVNTATNTLNAGDLNGDGNIDLTYIDFPGWTVSVMLGTGEGTFGPRQSYSADPNMSSLITMELGDVNNDGITDVVTGGNDAGSNTVVNVFLGKGDGTLQASQTFSTGGSNVILLSLGDFNNDDNLDLINYESNSELGISLGRGDGTFGTRTSVSAGFLGAAADQHFTTADFNGDDALDFAVANFAGGMDLFLGAGDGSFNHSLISIAVNNPQSIVSGDFNGDQNADLVVEGLADHVAIRLGNGDGSFQGDLTAPATGAHGLVLNDFNNDGVMDLVTANTTDDEVLTLLATTSDGVAPILPFSLKTSADARQAMPIFEHKLEQLTAQRGAVGSFNSRLEAAMSNLTAMVDQFTGAHSRIMDADVAHEAAELTRLNILQQASAAILAQANQQMALGLLLLE